MTEHERRDGAARPRLELPRFEFGGAQQPIPAAGTTPLGGIPSSRVTLRKPSTNVQPRATLATAPFSSAPMYQQHAPTPTQYAPQPQVTQQQVMPRPVTQPAPYAHPQPHRFAAASTPAQQPFAPQLFAPQHPQPYVHGAAAPAMAPPVPAPAPSPADAMVPPHALAPTPVPAPATAAAISWDRLEQPDEERTLLQKITPVHMGFLMVGIVLLLIISSKPGAIKATTSALPAVAAGGGMASPVMPVQPSPAPAAIAAAAKTKMIRIGSGELPVTAQHGGIPSAAATYAMSHPSGGGGPGTSDGVTLPRSDGERDSPADVSHSGGGGAPAEPVMPVVTPGQAAKVAEQMAAQSQSSQIGDNITTAAERNLAQ